MHPFASYVLRNYYKATGWNEDNLYANLTRSSNSILDFAIPHGLHFSVSKSPSSLFKTSYSMTAMPSLQGSLGYIFTSCDLDIKSSRSVRFKDMIDRFRVFDQPRKPEPKEEVYLAGERVDTRDYLLYGRLYLPTGRLDALYSLRISPNVQALVAAISDPPSSIPPDQQSRPDMSNIVINVQHDVGKWCTEYSWSAEDEMWGIKFLHNFGRLGSLSDIADEGGARRGLKRVDEEEPVEGGLKGRVSIGGELYFSAKEKSAGVSTGIRFTTLPDAPSSLSQVPGSPSSSQYLSAHRSPPTTITALFNPMLGHISAAYTAKVSRDLALSSRFDFNVYSFESEWTMGAEWWLRRPPRVPTDDDIGRMAPSQNNSLPLPEVNGVVKARASTNNDVSLMWEGRLRNMLVSLGVVSDLSSRSKFIKALGLEIAFFSSE